MLSDDRQAVDAARGIILQNADHVLMLSDLGCDHIRALSALLLALVGWDLDDVMAEIGHMDLLGVPHE